MTAIGLSFVVALAVNGGHMFGRQEGLGLIWNVKVPDAAQLERRRRQSAAR